MSKCMNFARLLALVARVWLLRIEAGEPAEAATFENTRDAGFGDAEFGRDVLLGVALTAQPLDDRACGKRDLTWR